MKKFDIIEGVNKIIVPDGYEISYKDGNSIEVVEEDTIMDNVVSKLKYDDDFQPYIHLTFSGITSKARMNKIMAINDLLTYMEYYNTKHPNTTGRYYTITHRDFSFTPLVVDDDTITEAFVYFNDERDCQRVINIMKDRLPLIYCLI